MAKKSMIARNNKRKKLVEKYKEKRANLKQIISNPESTDEEYEKALRELALLPRNSSPVRVENRCKLTGRPKAYMRKYGVSRIAFRELASNAKAPGVMKSSW